MWRNLAVASAVYATMGLIGYPANVTYAAARSSGAVLAVQMGDGRTPVTVRTPPRDIVPGDSFRTGANEVLEVLLPDGTSLLLGRGSELTVETLVHNPETPGGQLTVRLARGRVRVAGGSISRGGTLQVLTANGQVIVNNASANIVLVPNGTRTSFLSGDQVRVTSNDRSETLLTRPGFEVISSGNTLSRPTQSSREAMLGDAFEFNPGLKESLEIQSDSRGDEEQNQATTTLVASTRDEGTFDQPLPSDPFAPPARPGSVGEALEDGGGFGTAPPLGAPTLSQSLPSQTAQYFRTVTQNERIQDSTDPLSTDGFPEIVVDPGDPNSQLGRGSTFDQNEYIEERKPRNAGPTTNRLFNTTTPFTQEVTAVNMTKVVKDDDNDAPLQYVFVTSSNGIGAVVDDGGNQVLDNGNPIPVFGSNGSPIANSGTRLPLLVLDAQGDQVNIVPGKPPTLAPFILRRPSLGSSGLFGNDIFNEAYRYEVVNGGAFVREGSIFVAGTNVDGEPDQVDGHAVYRILQAGFTDTSRDVDNFLFIEARPGRLTQAATAAGGLGGTPTAAQGEFDTGRTEQFVFATGDVDDPAPDNTFAVHHFFLSAGSQGYEEKSPNKGVASGMRAFLRNDTALGLTLSDSGVLVAGDGVGATGEKQNALLHADFGLSGTGDTQKSTISVTIGNVKYEMQQSDSSVEATREATVSGGRTIGSSQDNSNRTSGKAEAATFISSPFFSTSAGGGNSDINMRGRAGYFVFENYEPTSDIPATNAGTEKPLNGSNVNYAMLRLATATGNQTVGARTTNTTNGFVAGLVEFQNAGTIGVTQLDSGDTAQGFSLNTVDTTNRVSANVSLYTKSNTPSSLTLGGLTGESTKGASAFIDDKNFAARDNGGNVALVSGDLVKAGLPGSMQGQIANYQYLQWGFFFGDVVPTTDAREHAHLASWIAGKVPNAADLPTTGTGSYGGHAIGNVYNNGSLYTAVGSYHNNWDFGARRGTVTMDFDGADYSGTTTLANGTANFSGRINTTNREGGVFGSFVQGGTDPAAAQMGRFSINETSGSAYRASGTFGAEKQP